MALRPHPWHIDAQLMNKYIYGESFKGINIGELIICLEIYSIWNTVLKFIYIPALLLYEDKTAA